MFEDNHNYSVLGVKRTNMNKTCSSTLLKQTHETLWEQINGNADNAVVGTNSMNQVSVVRFYQSALPPRPRHPPPPRLAVLFLLVLLLASSSSFSSTMSASTSTCTSALPTLRQALCQLSSPTLCAKLFANFPAQCAPLDINLGPAQLGVPAGPQPGTCPAQCAPLDLNGQIECQKRCQIECEIECQKICQIECQKLCQIKCQKICQIECQKICQIECQKIC